MSTLGGSRGERNAKPKFSALDINRMYKNSRGETTEPSAQKNQVPRKHGMQSLGKVPSARRPPANLPSLKAETTSSPTIANNNITGSEGKFHLECTHLPSIITNCIIFIIGVVMRNPIFLLVI
ncbi:hypothetical protein DOY81_007474 [Sarcophaga bullata]|nr:hypothetical protein DOY81_007474 [Sarcophaga bullata]